MGRAHGYSRAEQADMGFLKNDVSILASAANARLERSARAKAQRAVRIAHLQQDAWPGLHRFAEQPCKSVRSSGYAKPWRRCQDCGVSVMRGKDMVVSTCVVSLGGGAPDRRAKSALHAMIV
eukprot:15440677-Alexandrium_andersonii.AAC.1